MTYSTNTQQLVLKKHSEGSTISRLAKEFEISPQTIQTWKKNIEPKTYKHKPRKIDNELHRKDVEIYPDAYQHERTIRFNCSKSGIGKALTRLGLTQKKDSQSL